MRRCPLLSTTTASSMFTTITTITGAWATATELAPLLLVPAAIWGVRTAFELLDHIAAAARFTYATGRAAGRLWFTYGQPAFLAAADAVSWVIAQIDWAEVAQVLRHGTAAVIAACAVLTASVHTLLVGGSENLGKAYAALIAAPASVPSVTKRSACISKPVRRTRRQGRLQLQPA